MARATATTLAYDGSVVPRNPGERSRLKDVTSTTYPRPPTVRNVTTSGEVSFCRNRSDRDIVTALSTGRERRGDMSVGQLAPAPGQHPEHRFANDVAGHLRGSNRAVGEGDRHFDDPQPEPACAPGVLDLEAVAVRI